MSVQEFLCVKILSCAVNLTTACLPTPRLCNGNVDDELDAEASDSCTSRTCDRFLYVGCMESGLYMAGFVHAYISRLFTLTIEM